MGLEGKKKHLAPQRTLKGWWKVGGYPYPQGIPRVQKKRKKSVSRRWQYSTMMNLEEFTQGKT